MWKVGLGGKAERGECQLGHFRAQPETEAPEEYWRGGGCFRNYLGSRAWCLIGRGCLVHSRVRGFPDFLPGCWRVVSCPLRKDTDIE